MTIKKIIQKLNTTMTDASGQESPFESWLILNQRIIDALKALDKQEPVAWMNDSTPSGIFARHIDGARNFGCTIPLYTTPPQRMAKRIEDLETEQDCVGWFGYDTGLRLWFETNKGDDGAIPLYKRRRTHD